MLQTNLIFGIQQKIKEGKRLKEVSVLEESTSVTQKAPTKEILLENYYNPSIASGIHEQVKNSKKETTLKKTLMTESFNIAKAEKKLSKDINYFNYLYENFVDDVFKEDYEILLESIFQDTIKLYQECDVTPRLLSPAMESRELNENQIVGLYKNNLNESIKNNYTKPLLSGKINELYESEITTLTKKLIEEGVTADIEQVRVYMPFEETIYQFNKSVIIPEIAQSRMEAYIESTTDEYNEMIEECALDMMKGLGKKVKLLSSMVGPNMFSKAVDIDGVDAPKMAGISITIDDNFNDDIGDCGDGGCPMDAMSGDMEANEEFQSDEEAMDLDPESLDAENASEMSASEDSIDGDQPGAIEVGLPSETGSLDAGGYANNNSDVGLQGNGNDSGEAVARDDSTLPGGGSASSPTNVSDEALSTEIDTGTSAGSVSLPGSAGSTNNHYSNSGDVGLQGGGNKGGETTTSGGASLPGGAQSNETGATNSSDTGLSNGVTPASGFISAETVGADGDDSNSVLGVSAEPVENEVNTDTPTGDEMSKVQVEDSSMPRI